MFQAVLFDLDGTLLDRDQSVVRFIHNQYERLYDVLCSVPKEQYVARFIELDNHGYVWKDHVYEQLVTEFQLSSITWQELLQDYVEQFHHHCVAFPHIYEMLEALTQKNIALGIITNGYGQFQMDNIHALNIAHYFNVIFVSEWEGMKKPNPQIFLKALQQLHVAPSESVFIGDHPENDVKAAQRVGMKGIWKGNDQWTHVEADARIDDYLQLPALLKNLYNCTPSR